MNTAHSRNDHARKVRTRFAPSPTGLLHLGSARTALYAWLYAKHTKGTFILRIEDTDPERSTQASVEAILEGMEWMDLAWDEGPYFQTQRFDRYREVAKRLLDEGKAYKCYCTKERLEALREEQLAKKEKPRYDGFCRHRADHPTNIPFVIRFLNPQTGSVVFNDFVRGRVEIQNSELDDLIIQRSDGTPTYNFTVVVDDWDMQITHVIRGDDHINNTPRQINIFNALDAPVPLYAHTPTILGEDGKRLSKRHGAVSVQQYRAMGILPQALLNYLVRLGWSHGDQELFSREEMIQWFDFDALNKAAAQLNMEKLLWINQHYLKTLPPESLVSELTWHFQELGVDVTKGPDLQDVIIAQRERAKTLREIADKSLYFYQDIESIQAELMEKHFDPIVYDALAALRTEFTQLPAWDKAHIHAALEKTADRMGLKLGKIAQPLRIVLTGSTVSPFIDMTAALLGQAKTLERLDRVLNRNKNANPQESQA